MVKKYDGPAVDYKTLCSEMKVAKRKIGFKLFGWSLATGLALGMVYRQYHALGVIDGWSYTEGIARTTAKELGIPLTD